MAEIEKNDTTNDLPDSVDGLNPITEEMRAEREFIELIAYKGDIDDPESCEWFYIKPPTLGEARRWMQLVTDMKERKIEANSEEGVEMVSEFIVGLINDEGFTVEDANAMRTDYYISMFSASRVNAWVSQMNIPEKKMQEILNVARMKSKQKAKKGFLRNTRH